MKKKTLLCLFLILLSFSFIFAGGLKEVKEDQTNNFKVVSLAPNVTEIICALGGQENLVARTDYCNYPSSVTEIQSIGDMYDPNLELIISLQPDAVIASSIVSPDVVSQLNNFGITTYQFFHEYEGLDGTLTLIKEIGDVINKTDEATDLINKLKEKELKILSKSKDIASKKTCTVLITWGDWGDYAATGDTFIEDMMQKAGTINIASESSYWAISRELLLTKDPDVIFITDTSNYVQGDIVEAFKNTEPYKQLKASKNNCVYVLDSDATSRQSIRSYDILETIAKIVYPEIFKNEK